jgi:uncharacterized Tic20 family protein
VNETNPQPPAAGGAVTPAQPSEEQRRWAMFAHLSILLGGLISTGWAGGIGYFVGPLIIWILKRETMPFVADQGKEALNFAITVSIICAALWLLTIMSLGIGLLLTFPLLTIIGIASLVLVIIAAVKANEGTAYRYPIALRLVK